MTKKMFLQWVSVGRAKVLYHDREIVLLRAFGSESLFQPSGHASLTSFNRKHPASKNIPEPHGRWRIHPDSVKTLKVARKKTLTRRSKRR